MSIFLCLVSPTLTVTLVNNICVVDNKTYFNANATDVFGLLRVCVSCSSSSDVTCLKNRTDTFHLGKRTFSYLFMSTVVRRNLIPFNQRIMKSL